MATEKLESWSFCLSRKPSRSGWDVETTRSGYGYDNCKANVLYDYKGWYIVRLKEGQITYRGHGCSPEPCPPVTCRPAGN